MPQRRKKGTDLINSWTISEFRSNLNEAGSIKNLCESTDSGRNAALKLYQKYYTAEERKAMRSRAISIPKHHRHTTMNPIMIASPSTDSHHPINHIPSISTNLPPLIKESILQELFDRFIAPPIHFGDNGRSLCDEAYLRSRVLFLLLLYHSPYCSLLNEYEISSLRLSPPPSPLPLRPHSFPDNLTSPRSNNPSCFNDYTLYKDINNGNGNGNGIGIENDDDYDYKKNYDKNNGDDDKKNKKYKDNKTLPISDSLLCEAIRHYHSYFNFPNPTTHLLYSLPGKKVPPYPRQPLTHRGIKNILRNWKTFELPPSESIEIFDSFSIGFSAHHYAYLSSSSSSSSSNSNPVRYFAHKYKKRLEKVKREMEVEENTNAQSLDPMRFAHLTNQ